MKWLGSRTFWGSLFVAVGHAIRSVKPDDANAQLVGTVLESGGVVVAGVGVRAAIAKNGQGK